jgi:hypothetical protein
MNGETQVGVGGRYDNNIATQSVELKVHDEIMRID